MFNASPRNVGGYTWWGIIEELERRISKMVAQRHDYPLWPLHEYPLNELEEAYHGTMRHVHYQATIQLIRTLRGLHSLNE